MGRIGSSEEQRLLWIEGLGRKERARREILAGGCIWGSSRDKMGLPAAKELKFVPAAAGCPYHEGGC